MIGLTTGQRLDCGCVVGAYWCGPHDIYARRSKLTYTWRMIPSEQGGGFGMESLPPNSHRPDSDFRSTPSDYDSKDRDYGDVQDRGCSCHINPPCSYCVDGGYCEKHCSMRIECGCEL